MWKRVVNFGVLACNHIVLRAVRHTFEGIDAKRHERTRLRTKGGVSRLQGGLS